MKNVNEMKAILDGFQDNSSPVNLWCKKEIGVRENCFLAPLGMKENSNQSITKAILKLKIIIFLFKPT